MPTPTIVEYAVDSKVRHSAWDNEALTPDAHHAPYGTNARPAYVDVDIENLLDSQCPGHSDQRDSRHLPPSTIDIVRRSHAVMDQFANEPIQVSELARLVGVSVRTLQTTFKSYYQIGPCQYLRLRQLHLVRRDLLVADADDQTVTDILLRWGIWEFGRFAGRYKVQFGELPRDTLRKAPLPGFSGA